MNSVMLIGRMTKDPDVKNGNTTVARFSIAIDRGKNRNGEDMGTDYPNIVCFGKTAELVEKYLGKGRLVGISGKLHTDSYEKDGRKIYTTDVIADRVEFLDRGEKKDPEQMEIPTGFSKLNDDINF